MCATATEHGGYALNTPVRNVLYTLFFLLSFFLSLFLLPVIRWSEPLLRGKKIREFTNVPPARDLPLPQNKIKYTENWALCISPRIRTSTPFFPFTPIHLSIHPSIILRLVECECEAGRKELERKGKGKGKGSSQVERTHCAIPLYAMPQEAPMEE
ncbi:hypothetical protein HOY80DRAFT_562509 [Tuber brumale]|nr:hypothetical protein HOY80DRAFT_562509 [Tuber brumale]